MTQAEVLHWLYAIETVANDAGEAGDFDLQDDCCEWFAEVRRAIFEAEDKAKASSTGSRRPLESKERIS